MIEINKKPNLKRSKPAKTISKIIKKLHFHLADSIPTQNLTTK